MDIDRSQWNADDLRRNSMGLWKYGVLARMIGNKDI